MWWFGKEAWPSPENPAPVCADPDRRIATPVGSKCIECGKRIVATDRGIVTPASPGLWETWHLAVTGYLHTVCSYHLSCFLNVVVGGEIEGTTVERRMENATRTTTELSDENVIEPDAKQLEDETHQPGKGWR